MYIMYNGKPCVVVYFQHVKPGKGPAFVKTKLRNLENGRILENTFTAGVKLDTISVERRPYQYLYDDGEAFNFMHEETYEQITLPHDVVENADLMKEGQRVEMMFLTEPEERCLTCELPTYVTLEVTYSEPGHPRSHLQRAGREGQHRLHLRPEGSHPRDRCQDHGPALHRDR